MSIEDRYVDERHRVAFDCVGYVNTRDRAGTEAPPGWYTAGSQQFCTLPGRPGFATFDQAWAEHDFAEALVEVEVSTDPADDDTDYDPWIDRPFTPAEMQAIQSAGDSDEVW